jgi:hypothetical protein
LNVTAAWDDAPSVLKNSTEGENSDLRDSIGFRKIQKKSAKFEKIWTKRTRDDGGIVEIRNTKIRPVLVIYRPTSSINRWFFPEFTVAIFGRIFQKPGEFCQKSVNGKKKLWKTTT